MTTQWMSAPRRDGRALLVANAAAGGTVALLSLVATPALSQSGEDWLGTWSASPQPVWGADFFAPASIPRSLRDQTVRQVARVSQGGDRVRVELADEYGDGPLAIGRARLAMAGEDGAILPGSAWPLTFSGREGVAVPPGAPIWSDPVDMELDDLSEVAVSLYLPEVTPLTTWHNDGRQTATISGEGDFTEAETFEAAETTRSRLFLSGIQVGAGKGARSVVLFGDSITEGDSSTPDENARWPDVLAERLVEAGSEVAVLNEGISGARVLRDRMGDNALARFDRDVLSHPQADTVVVMIGINDIGWPGTRLVPEGEPAPSAESVVCGYEQPIARAHAQDTTIVGAALAPFEDTFAGGPLKSDRSEGKEAKRRTVDDPIRTSGAFDAVIDFDAVLRDLADPEDGSRRGTTRATTCTPTTPAAGPWQRPSTLGCSASRSRPEGRAPRRRAARGHRDREPA